VLAIAASALWTKDRGGTADAADDERQRLDAQRTS